MRRSLILAQFAFFMTGIGHNLHTIQNCLRYATSIHLCKKSTVMYICSKKILSTNLSDFLAACDAGGAGATSNPTILKHRVHVLPLPSFTHAVTTNRPFKSRMIPNLGLSSSASWPAQSDRARPPPSERESRGGRLARWSLCCSPASTAWTRWSCRWRTRGSGHRLSRTTRAMEERDSRTR